MTDSPFTGKFKEVYESLDYEVQEALLDHMHGGTSANALSLMFESVNIKLAPTTIKEQRSRLLEFNRK